MAVNRRLLSLAAGHIVLGMIAGLLAQVGLTTFFDLFYILQVPLDASVPCQAVLLAFWGATSRGLPWRRMAGLVAGAVYLEALFSSISWPLLTGMSTITVTVTTATLLVVRTLGVSLTRPADTAQPSPSETQRFRLSIRGLMLATAAVALLSAGARAIKEAPASFVLFMVGWALHFVTVGLVALWAALGWGHPLWRGPAVFALSLVLGALFAFTDGATAAGWVQTILIVLLYPTLLFGSLLIVRSCGYRFVRRAVSPSKLPDEQTGSLPLEIPANGVTAPE